MKRTLLTVAVIVASAGALAQGTVNFSNAPSQIGGTQGQILDADGSTPLDGASYYTQLFMGPDPTSVTPQGAAVNFLTGAGVGYFSGGSVTVQGVAPGTDGIALVAAWEASGGNTWDQALANGVLVGQSAAFDQATGGAGVPPSVPANMVNMVGFSLVPEPSTAALGILGAIALMLRRRR